MRSIVAYQSSDEGGEEEPTTEELVEKIDKRRSLPPLAQSFLPVVPVGDPALHQGRRRTTPHVEGQWVAHVYVPVRVEMWESLYSVMRDAGESASRLVKGLVLMGEDASKKEGMELHVSLTRPTYLRAHQREDLKRAIRSAALNHTAFTASFVRFTSLMNDERTRTFLAMEIGAGHAEFKALVDALTPILRDIRQKEFYACPTFHASFAWALLDPPDASPTPQTSTPSPMPTPPPPSFQTIPHFPPTLIPTLNETFGAKLAQRMVSSFEVSEIRVRIGKEVSVWKLRQRVGA